MYEVRTEALNFFLQKPASVFLGPFRHPKKVNTKFITTAWVVYVYSVEQIANQFPSELLLSSSSSVSRVSVKLPSNCWFLWLLIFRPLVDQQESLQQQKCWWSADVNLIAKLTLFTQEPPGRSPSLGACSYLIFLSRRFHRPIYF